MISKINNRFIPITDDYMFCTVMEDEGRCKELLQRVLGIEISEIKSVCNQKSIQNTKDARGIRLDIYIKDMEGNSYDIEMQTTTDKNIIKRSRYYHSEMDGYQIRKGTPISRLGKNIVIFICAYDPFGKNASIYSVKSMCKEHAEINYDDGMETIFINIYGDRDGVDCNLKNVLEYFKTGEGNDDYTKTLEDAVNRQNSDEDWRQRYMTFEMKLEQRYEQGFDDGIQQGRESIICELYSKGLISKSDATASLSISDEDFDILVKNNMKVSSIDNGN